MKRLGYIVEKLSDIFGHLSEWLLVLLMALVLVEVLFRYVVKQPLMIADEFGGYLLVAIIFLGGAYTWRQKGHIRVTALVERLPLKASKWLRLVTLVLALGASVMLSLASYNYLTFSFARGMKSPTWLHTPLQGPQMTLLIGFSLLSLLLIVEVVKAIMNIRAGRELEEKAQ